MERHRWFAEYAIGGVHNRNAVHEVSSFRLGSTIRDCYRSLFLFDEGIQLWVKRTGSVKGYAGPHIAEEIVFDFDGREIEVVRDEVVRFLDHLEVEYGVPKPCVDVTFSGNKGFHVSIPIPLAGDVAPSPDFWRIYKAVANDLAAGFKYVDPAIYEIRRLIRMTNTINSKSGLYKVPLTTDEVEALTVDEIRGLAAARRDVGLVKNTPCPVIPALQSLIQKWRGHNWDKPSTALTTAKDEWQSLLHGVAQGSRNSSAVRLVGVFIARRFEQSEVLELMRMWNQSNSPPLEEAELVELVQGTYKRYAQGEKQYDVRSVASLTEDYENFISTPEDRKIKTGFPSIDKKIRSFVPGELFTIVAKSGNAKTSLLQNIMRNYAMASSKPVVFISLEMPDISTYERIIQMSLDVSGEEIEQRFRSNDTEFKSRVRVALSGLNTLHVVARDIATLDDIRACILQAEQTVFRGQKTGLVGIDYLSLLSGKGRDVFEQTGHNARGLKMLAKELALPIIMLVQTTKNNSLYDELTQDSGRDSGAILEASDYLLTMWRKKEEPSDNTLIQFVASLEKNRKGGVGRIDLLMSKKSLRIWEGASKEDFSDNPEVRELLSF